MGSGPHVDARYTQQPSSSLRQLGQASRGRANVLASAIRQGEGIRSGLYIDALYS